MKKYFNFMYLLIMFSLIMLLTSCGIENKNDAEQAKHNSNEYTLYTDNNIAENDVIKIEVDSSIYSLNNFSLTVTVKVTNKEYKTNSYDIKNYTLIKESTGATYTVGTMFSIPKLQIDAELSQSLSLSSTIPTSIKDDQYKMSFDVNEYKITYYLYETPDELRADRKISFSISGAIVHEETIKDKRKLETKYVYESKDNLYYCDNWYTDSSFINLFNSSNPITEDTMLYGRNQSNISWSTLYSDKYSFVSGVNHVPSNKVLVIPSQYLGKDICLSNYAIYNITVDKIYVPKTVRVIYGGNFLNVGNAKIYYEGTEEEWKALFYISLDTVTNNVYYNTKYNG